MIGALVLAAKVLFALIWVIVLLPRHVTHGTRSPGLDGSPGARRLQASAASPVDGRLDLLTAIVHIAYSPLPLPVPTASLNSIPRRCRLSPSPDSPPIPHYARPFMS